MLEATGLDIPFQSTVALPVSEVPLATQKKNWPEAATPTLDG